MDYETTIKNAETSETSNGDSENENSEISCMPAQYMSKMCTRLQVRD